MWGKDDSYMRRTFSQFPAGTIRKFGKVWIVTREGMEARYGPATATKE
ncbi:helix-turn-helix domain-containing protein [Saccharibacillus deserti]